MTNLSGNEQASADLPGRRPGRPPGPSDARARRQALVEAALRIIGRAGLVAATTRAIAQEAGLNQAMVHYCFPDKQALLDAVLSDVQARTRHALQSAVIGATTLEAALKQIARAYWSHVQNDQSLQRVQYELTLASLNRADGNGLAQRQYEGYVAMLAEALASASGRPSSSPDLQRLAGIAVALMDGLILQLLATQDHRAVQARLESGLAMLCRPLTDGEQG